MHKFGNCKKKVISLKHAQMRQIHSATMNWKECRQASKHTKTLFFNILFIVNSHLNCINL